MTLKNIKDILINLDIDEIANAVKSELQNGTNPQEIMNALTEGVDEVGKLYENRDYYLAELVLAGEIMKRAMKILEPNLKLNVKGNGKPIIVATVRGDNHDIGKNILVILLKSSGFDVIDLGTDCPVDRIVETIKERHAKVLALSTLLTMTIDEIAVVDKALKDKGIREQVKIIVGGAPLNSKIAKKMGADEFADDAVSGVRTIMKLYEGNN